MDMLPSVLWISLVLLFADIIEAQNNTSNPSNTNNETSSIGIIIGATLGGVVVTIVVFTIIFECYCGKHACFGRFREKLKCPCSKKYRSQIGPPKNDFSRKSRSEKTRKNDVTPVQTPREDFRHLNAKSSRQKLPPIKNTISNGEIASRISKLIKLNDKLSDQLQVEKIKIKHKETNGNDVPSAIQCEPESSSVNTTKKTHSVTFSIDTKEDVYTSSNGYTSHSLGSHNHYPQSQSSTESTDFSSNMLHVPT